MGVKNQILAGIAAGIGAFSLGTSLGWSGTMQDPVVDGDAYKFNTSKDDWGWVSSMLNFGAACMCIPAGMLIAKFGRKLIMLTICIPYLCGWGCIIAAQHVSMLYVGRFVVGACGGAFCVMAPMYTTEIAEVRIRGVMGCFFQLLLVIGILYVFVLGAFLPPLGVNIACGILPILFIIAFIWFPESPVYLTQIGKGEKAEKALKWLRGGDEGVKEALAGMAAEAQKEKINIKEALGRKVALKGLGIGIALMLFQQVTGINAILFYVTQIFKDAGTDLKPEYCTIIVGVVQVIATVVAVLLVERLGRKLLLLISAAVMAITTLIMGVYFMWLTKENVGWLPIMAISLFIVGFSMGFGPVPWVVMAELFSEDVKPVCGAIVGTSSWLLAFTITKIFPLMVDGLKPAFSFWVFTICAVIACVFIIFFVPETKNRELQEIQALLK